MRLLLDTHTVLWWFTDDSRLSKAARRAIALESNQIFVSAASAWEIAIKHRLGKLEGVPDAAARFVDLMEADGFTPLPMTHRHALLAGSYKASHGDPFDRMLAAQSELEKLVLVTRDQSFRTFQTRILW